MTMKHAGYMSRATFPKALANHVGGKVPNFCFFSEEVVSSSFDGPMLIVDSDIVDFGKVHMWLNATTCPVAQQIVDAGAAAESQNE